jgi:hypothetical protein
LGLGALEGEMQLAGANHLDILLISKSVFYSK